MSDAMLDAACKTLHVGLDLIVGPASTSTTRLDATQWKALIGRVKGDVSKVGMLWSADGPPPTAVVAEGAVSALVQTLMAFCTTSHAFTAGGGPTLLSALHKMAASVVHPSVQLLQALAHPDASLIRACIGKVWSACDAAERAPRDNRTAVFKSAGAVLVVLKDTLREVTELHASGTADATSGQVEDDCVRPRPAANGHAAGGTGCNGHAATHMAGHHRNAGDDDSSSDGLDAPSDDGGQGPGDGAGVAGASGRAATDGELEGAQARASAGRSGRPGSGAALSSADAPAADEEDHDDGDGDDDDGGDDELLDFDAGRLSGAEARVVDASRQLIEVSVSCLTTLMRPLLQGPPLAAGSALDAWESSLFHCRALQRCAEDLGAALYPPQDGDEVGSCAQSLRDCVELLIDEREEVESDDVAPQLQQVRQRIELAHQQLVVAVAAVEAEG